MKTAHNESRRVTAAENSVSVFSRDKECSEANKNFNPYYGDSCASGCFLSTPVSAACQYSGDWYKRPLPSQTL